jgi:hypothetical protein
VALAALALVPALVLAGCSTPGGVDEYSDADFQVRRNFIDACLTANSGEDLSDEDAQSFCDCWWRAVEETVPFEQFKKDNEAIKDAIDEGRFNNQDDFETVAGATYRAGRDEGCIQVGPTPG